MKSTIPSTIDFDRFLRREMAILFIRKPRQNYGYAYVFFFDVVHFSHPIEPVKPKRAGYIYLIATVNYFGNTNKTLDIGDKALYYYLLHRI